MHWSADGERAVFWMPCATRICTVMIDRTRGATTHDAPPALREGRAGFADDGRFHILGRPVTLEKAGRLASLASALGVKSDRCTKPDSYAVDMVLDADGWQVSEAKSVECGKKAPLSALRNWNVGSTRDVRAEWSSLLDEGVQYVASVTGAHTAPVEFIKTERGFVANAPGHNDLVFFDQRGEPTGRYR